MNRNLSFSSEGLAEMNTGLYDQTESAETERDPTGVISELLTQFVLILNHLSASI